jgi:hypothetical protein
MPLKSHETIPLVDTGPEAGFLVWIGYVPVLNYVPFRRKGMTLEKKCP